MEKKTRNQLIIVSAVGILAATASYFLFLKPKKEYCSLNNDIARDNPEDCYSAGSPIRRGSCCEDVKILQRHLKKKRPEAIIKTDGIFGATTQLYALKLLNNDKFQQSYIKAIEKQLKK